MAGCASGGAVDIIELNFKRMPSAGPLVDHVTVQEALWWITDNRVYVALRSQQGGALSELHREGLEMSFVLEGLPAAQARDYPLNRQSVRIRRSQGARHARFASTIGIAALWFEPGDVLRGRFRTMLKRQSFHILTGWSDGGQAAAIGEFRARRDQVRGEEILQSTEADGMERRISAGVAPLERGRPTRVEGPPGGRE
jgi:hypothetical protein